MFSIYDDAAKVFLRPFTARNDGEALRVFSDMSVAADHVCGQHPEHFALFRVGQFDDNLGLPEPERVPVRLKTGLECVAESQQSMADSDNNYGGTE